MNRFTSQGVARRLAGFTLLEVLVALAILALVMLVLGQTVGSAIEAYSRLDQKTRAWMVASDKLVEMQVYARWPAIGTQKETLEKGGDKWQLTTKVSAGPFSGTRRVDIDVALPGEDGKGGLLYTLSSLLGDPGQTAVTSTKSGTASGSNNPAADREETPATESTNENTGNDADGGQPVETPAVSEELAPSEAEPEPATEPVPARERRAGRGNRLRDRGATGRGERP